ncbi:MAG: gamma-glutamylcyclotransferase family protein, partial [Ramlibacter sp.]
MPEAPSPASPRHVFVYGTLRRGGRNDINRLSPAPRYVGMGEVQGALYHIGWYPGLTLGGQEAVTVVGEVYEIGLALEAVLDGIEEVVPGPDSEYFKREL